MPHLDRYRISSDFYRDCGWAFWALVCLGVGLFGLGLFGLGFCLKLIEDH